MLHPSKMMTQQYRQPSQPARRHDASRVTPAPEEGRHRVPFSRQRGTLAAAHSSSGWRRPASPGAAPPSPGVPGAGRVGHPARERGTVSIEAAVAGVVFFVLMMATLDLARMHYYRTTLRHAVSQGTRFAITGQTLTDADGNSQTRDASIEAMIEKLSMGVNVPHEPIEITAKDGMGNVVNGSGGPGDIVTVSMTYHVAVLVPGLRNLFPGGTYTFTCSTSFRNEEFDTTASSGSSPSGATRYAA
jgi:Flp pilus assembly protein TadG